MSAMSDGSPVSPELDARMLAELREWRRRADTSSGSRWSMRLTVDELDMLLRVADERDALKAASCAQWEAEIPDEIRQRAEAPRPGVMHIAGENGALCGVVRPSHITDGVRYADCPECIRRAEAGS